MVLLFCRGTRGTVSCLRALSDGGGLVMFAQDRCFFALKSFVGYKGAGACDLSPSTSVLTFLRILLLLNLLLPVVALRRIYIASHLVLLRRRRLDRNYRLSRYEEACESL